MTQTTAIPIPGRMTVLPLDKHGRPVPWFVAWIDGVPDFRIIGPGKIVQAVKERRCWVCGGPLGVYKAFLLGPMCAVNRNTAEPPCHLDCAVYSAKACPFLTTPHMRRRETGKPAEASNPAGIMIERNPGVALVWVTKTFRIWPEPDRRSALFEPGDPTRTLWFTQGREATHAEVMASIDSGLPLLREMAVEQGPEAEAHLDRQLAAALRHVPAEPAP